MNYILGIDGGGTKTQLLLADQLGKEVAKIEVGPTSLVAAGQEKAKQNLVEGLTQVTEAIKKSDDTIEIVVFGLASVDTESEEAAAAKIFQPIMSQFNVEQFTILNDAVLALVNGTDRDNAIVLISGTGSNCYGENDQGETAKAGGLDYLLSDEGSGYEIGRHVLKAAVNSYDGRGLQTVLEKLVLEHFKVGRVPELKSKVYQPDLSKAQIAKISPLLFKALEQDDAAAQMIFNHAVDELWLMITTVAENLDLIDKKFDLVLGGSIATSIPMIQALNQQLKQNFPQAELILPHQPAVYGALKLALK
jgi:N-acetylglucosamine kinase-like BadF-type ATPase